MIRLRFVRATRMILNNHWPFDKAEEVFFEALPRETLAAVENLIHHVQPGADPINRKKVFLPT
jgi:hypothetical protein